MKNSFIIVSFFLFIAGCRSPHNATVSLVNFAHLESLSEIISFQGDSVAIVHIYSEYPDYKWVDASSEGIACVDDVARAAVLRCRHYELTGDRQSLRWARYYLKFILKMQTEDGEFYNFIDKNHQINKTGKTSYLSFNWWAMRGYHALAVGYRAFQKQDPAFALQLKQSFLRCQQPITKLLQNYRQTEIIGGRNYPTWLVNHYAADATSDLVQALTAYLKTIPEAELLQCARQLAEGILLMQVPVDSVFSGAFLSYPDIWHAWGNSQTIALAELTYQMLDSALLAGAEKEVCQFYPQLLLGDGLNEYLLSTGDCQQFPQIAYGIRCFAVGALAYSHASGDTSAARLAGLFASWFFGNNAAGLPMYEPATGRGYDGLLSESGINRNAGAESTIEALQTLLEIEQSPLAVRFLSVKPMSEKQRINLPKLGESEYRMYTLKEGECWVLTYSHVHKNFAILAEEKWQNLIKQP